MLRLARDAVIKLYETETRCLESWRDIGEVGWIIKTVSPANFILSYSVLRGFHN